MAKIKKDVLRKYMVITCMCIACAGCIWYIFSPSSKEKEIAAQEIGLNMDVPDPVNDKIYDKKEAYEKLDSRNDRTKDYMLSLQEFAESLNQKQEEFPVELSVSAPVTEPVNNPISVSSSAYSDLGRNLSTLYQSPNTEVHEQEILELTWRIQELENKLEENDHEKKEIDRQFEILERSYELAAKYMPNSGSAVTANYSEEPTTHAISTRADKNREISVVKPAPTRLYLFYLL